MKNIYLSPHNDDVAFSIGWFVYSNKSGVIVSIYTRSKYLCVNWIFRKALNLIDRFNIKERIKYTTRKRNKEDVEFSEMCKLQRINLGLDDTSISGYGSLDASQIQGDVDRLNSVLRPILLSLPFTENVRLYCPAAIGNHRDHLSTLLFVIENINDFSEKFKICFYEDLPYAKDYVLRAGGLHRLKSLLCGRVLKRVEVMLDENQQKTKNILVSLYESQLNHEIKGKNFSPATLVTDLPHEAFWELV